MKTEVTFTYKNYRGEISVRLVRPIMISFGATGFHPEPQWLLHGWDINKDAERTFAMKDIKDWDARPHRGWDEGEHEGCGIDSQRAFKKENL